MKPIWTNSVVSIHWLSKTCPRGKPDPNSKKCGTTNPFTLVYDTPTGAIASRGFVDVDIVEGLRNSLARAWPVHSTRK